jgi:putative Holliday junction resolvase
MPRSGDAGPTVLAFDYGLRRIGVAVGNTLTGTAEPLATLQARDGNPDWTALASCVREWQPGMLVVGVPYNMDGSAGELTGRSLEFAAELGRRFGLAVAPVDERLSSREAGEALRLRRRSGAIARRLRREDVDKEAACVLLRQWLEGRTGAAAG